MNGEGAERCNQSVLRSVKPRVDFSSTTGIEDSEARLTTVWRYSAVAAPRSPLLRFSSRAIICDFGLGLAQHIWIRCGVEVDYYGNSLLLDTHSSSCSSSYYADMPGSPSCEIWLLGSMNCPRVSPLSSQGSATLLRPLLPPLPLRNPGSLSI